LVHEQKMLREYDGAWRVSVFKRGVFIYFINIAIIIL
jgi:hypothetical protein